MLSASDRPWPESHRHHCELDQIALLEARFCHVLRIHFDERIGESIHDEIVFLVEIGRLPDNIGTTVVDQVPVIVLLLLFAWSLKAAPRRIHELRPAIVGREYAISIEPLRTLDLAFGKTSGWFLEAVVAHGAQAFIGDKLAAVSILIVAVHEGVFFRPPVEALELGCIGVITQLGQDPLHGVGEARGNQAVRHGLARRVHVTLSASCAARHSWR